MTLQVHIVDYRSLCVDGFDRKIKADFIACESVFNHTVRMQHQPGHETYQVSLSRDLEEVVS